MCNDSKDNVLTLDQGSGRMYKLSAWELLSTGLESWCEVLCPRRVIRSSSTSYPHYQDNPAYTFPYTWAPRCYSTRKLFTVIILFHDYEAMSDKIRESGLQEAQAFVSNHSAPYSTIDPKKADLSGKSVVITGASKGCGREAAIAFAQAGASKIALLARSDLSAVIADVKAAAKEAGRIKEPQIYDGSGVDVTSALAVEDFARKVGQAFGGSVDLLINNAAYLSSWHAVGETDPEDWWMNWEVNMKGLYLCTRYFLPLVLKSNSLKTILNVTSFGAINIGAGASGYQTSKFAVCRFTEHTAADYADEGLICVTVHPGSYMTDMGKKLPESFHDWLTDDVALSGQWMAWFARERREWLQARFVSATWDVEELEAKKDEIEQGDKLKFRLVL